MASPTGRTIGAALGAVVFVWFCASLADRLVNPVSAAGQTDISITVSAR